MSPAQPKIKKFDFSKYWNPSVMSRILGTDHIPTDKSQTPLITMKRTFVGKSVFPSEFEGIIYTPKISPCDFKGVVVKNRGKMRNFSDDITYKMYPITQRLFPRFCSVLHIYDIKTGSLVARHVLQGYYKFGGASKDEDSNIDTHGLLSKEKIEEATRAVVTEKSNGKGAVITMFLFKEELYVFGGSKSQHYAGRLDKGILSFEALNKDFFAWQILDAFFNAWNKLSPPSKKTFVEKLLKSKNSEFDGFTACGEYEDGKHMIPLPPNSPNRLIMFGLVKNFGPLEEGETFCEDVEESLKFFQTVGFPHTAFSVCSEEEIQKKKESLREKRGVEGFVIHHQKEGPEGGKFITLGVEKFKTWYYIVLRVVREFVRGRRPLKDVWKTKLRERLTKRNRDFMDIPPIMFEKWLKLSEKFIDWFTDNKISSDEIGFGTHNKGMGNIWQRFLEDTGESDEINMTPEDRKPPKNSPKALIIFQGIPGLGKTSLSPSIAAALRRRNHSPQPLEQDAFAVDGHRKRSGALCLQSAKSLIRGGLCDSLLLLRNNANFGQYRLYATAAQQSGWAVHAIAPTKLSSDLRTLAVCLYSVRGRKGHATFDGLSVAKRYAVTLGFFCAFERAVCRGPVTSTGEVNWLRPEAEGCELDAEAQSYLKELLGQVRAGRNALAFDEKRVDVALLEEKLRFDAINYHEWRLSEEEIAESVAENICSNCFKRPSTNVSVSPDMLYTLLPVEEPIMAELISLARKVGVDFNSLTKKIAKPHITMIFENKKGEKNRKIWNECLRLMEEKRPVKVVVSGVATRQSAILCFTCRIFDESTGADLVHLVKSGHPHITAMHSIRNKPADSISLLQSLSGDSPKENTQFLRLKKDVVFSSKVQVFRR